MKNNIYIFIYLYVYIFINENNKLLIINNFIL